MSRKKRTNNAGDFIPFENLVPKNGKIGKKQIITYIAIALVLIVCLFVKYSSSGDGWNDISKTVNVNQNVVEEEGKFYAHFIDVGQADCELLKCGDDVVLIDAGDVDGFENISSYLDSQGVTEIDYFIITHMHADHMGSAAKVIEKYKPKNIIMTKLTQENTPTTNLYKNLLKTISGCGAKIIQAKPGNAYELSSFGFVVLAPNDDYDELNNTSVVIKAYFGDTTYLFQGDAETKSENDILKNGYKVDADVLKLGHHGSKTSNSEKYLDAVNPKVAVACCGKDNKYNHPHKEILERLEERNIELCRTDKDGNVVVVSDGKEISIITER